MMRITNRAGLKILLTKSQWNWDLKTNLNSSFQRALKIPSFAGDTISFYEVDFELSARYDI